MLREMFENLLIIAKTRCFTGNIGFLLIWEVRTRETVTVLVYYLRIRTTLFSENRNNLPDCWFILVSLS